MMCNAFRSSFVPFLQHFRSQHLVHHLEKWLAKAGLLEYDLEDGLIVLLRVLL